MNISIVDSDESYREVLCLLIEMYLKKRYIHHEVQLYGEGITLTDDYMEQIFCPDVVFVDVSSPDNRDMYGIDLCAKLRQHGYNGEFILTAENNEKAIDGYEVEARAYLLKPYNPCSVNHALDRILTVNHTELLSITEKGRAVRIPLSNITYIESMNHKCCIHCLCERSHYVYKKLGDLESEMNDPHFLRCHQSYLVNMDYVCNVDDDFLMIDNSHVPVRQKGRKVIVEEFGKYLHFPDKKSGRLLKGAHDHSVGV